MSIILHTGIPGCGKTYYVMHELMFSGVQDKYFILHNIKGFKHEYFTSEHLKDWRGIAPEDQKSFFSIKYFETIVSEARSKFNKPVLLVVDEAWEFFEKLTPEQLEFFSWHRHIGMDIWLITQDKSDLDRGVRKRAEYEISGNKSTVIDEFLYIFRANRSQFRVRRLKKRKEVFQAYESFDVEGAKKPKSKILHYAAAAVVVAVALMVYGIGWALPNMFGSHRDKQSGAPVRVPDKEVRVPPPVRKDKPVLKKVENPSGVDWDKYSLSSVMGKRATIQDESGRLIRIEDLAPRARVVEYKDGCAAIFTGAASIEYVCKRTGIVKAKAEAPGGRGGMSSAPPGASAMSGQVQ